MLTILFDLVLEKVKQDGDIKKEETRLQKKR